jgi:PAS domain S-box-containing protein
MASGWLNKAPGPSRERLSRLAGQLLLLLAAEGVTAWILFEALFRPQATYVWIEHALLALYLLATFVVGVLLVVAWRRGGKAHRQIQPPQQPASRRTDREGVPLGVANALLAVSEAVSRLTRLDEILETVVEVAPRTLAVDYCGIALWAEDTRTYVGAVAAGAGPTIDHRFAGLRVTPEEAPDFEWVRRLGHCAVVPASVMPGTPSTAVPDMLIAPLVSGQRFYGVIQFARRGVGPSFTQRDLTIADGIARQTAVALERARLVEESRRLVRALESTGETVLITDAHGRVIFVNPAFRQTFGFRDEEILGHPATVLGGEGAAWIDELGPGAQPSGWRGESVAYGKDGTSIPVLADVSVIRGDEGEVQGGVAIIEDISAEKVLQEQMQRADRLAAVGQMAAGLAHEINNALAAIFGQTARSERLGVDELRRTLSRVDGQARRIADIAQSLLHFAQPRPPRAVAVDLVATAEATLNLIRHDVDRLGVRVDVVRRSDLPPALGDPQQVQQVLLNLFVNALQAMADCDGERSLRVTFAQQGGRLAVGVSDSGPGIPADLRSRIFDPFFSTKAEGSGLGLSVSYAIARAHGGDLLVASEEGQGSTFTFLIPIAATEAKSTLRRVLLVDDDPEVAEALADMLGLEGLQVERAASGGEALQKLSEGSWDAVFLDMRLPDLPGQEVAVRIQQMRPDLTGRVVFVTGGLWRQESRLREEMGAQRFLAKPCTQEQLRAVLRELSGDHQVKR